MAVNITDVLAFTESETSVVRSVVQKVHDDQTYIYWAFDDPNADVYGAKLASALSIWIGFDGFDGGYYVDEIVHTDVYDIDTVVGYTVKNGDANVEQRYNSISARSSSPFRFYTANEIYDWKYFNNLWIVVYDFLISTIINQNAYFSFLSISNMYIYNGKMYYQWLFDYEDTTDIARRPANHPTYEQLIKAFINDESSLNSIQLDVEADVEAGGTPAPFSSVNPANQPVRILDDKVEDVGNVLLTGETTLYTYTIPANTFIKKGDKIAADFVLTTAASATATREIKTYLGSNLMVDSGAITTPSATSIVGSGAFVYTGSGVIKYYNIVATSGGTTCLTGSVSGFDPTIDNTFTVTGTAGSTGAADNDIVLNMVSLKWFAGNVKNS